MTRHPEHGIVWLFTESEEAIMLDILGGLPLMTCVADANEKSCHRCRATLSSIKEGEIWYCQFYEDYCGACYTLEVPNLQERVRCGRDRERKMPHHIGKLKEQIVAHRHFGQLDGLTRMQYEECSKTGPRKRGARIYDNNQYMRNLWKHLYHGKEKPL